MLDALDNGLPRFDVIAESPMRPGETLALTVMLPNEQCIEVPEAVVRWSRGQEFVVEHMAMEPHIHGRAQ